jgi:hypothetical protein
MVLPSSLQLICDFGKQLEQLVKTTSFSRRATARRFQNRANIRPLRGFATHGEANTPSEASAELRPQEQSCFYRLS